MPAEVDGAEGYQVVAAADQGLPDDLAALLTGSQIARVEGQAGHAGTLAAGCQLVDQVRQAEDWAGAAAGF